ncbi:MAG: response regulator transcription factor [Myxococcales bacterium]|nr:response regulator transcription factor [Myxococcales bacterium]
MPLVRGTSLVHFRSYVREHYGAPALDRTLRAMDPIHALTIAHALPDEWYPAAAQHAALDALDRSVGRGDLSVLPALGAYQCSRDLASSLGWAFRLVSPARLLRNTDVLWRRFHSTGRWQCTLQPRSIHLALHEWSGGTRACCHLLRGYLGALLEQLAPSDSRGRGPPTLEHVRCRYRGAHACEFDIDASVSELAPLALDIGPGDIVHVGRELGQFTAHDVVCDAIAAVFRSQTHGCAASLSLVDARGTLRPVPLDAPTNPQTTAIAPSVAPVIAAASATANAPSTPPSTITPPRRWLLEARGRIVGRLEATLARHDPRGHTIGELVPWMAVALASAEGSHDDVNVAMNERIRTAVERWGLTARQEEVLRLVIEGRSNRQIALELARSEGTIEVHVKTLLEKASVHGRTELTARVATMPTRK